MQDTLGRAEFKAFTDRLYQTTDDGFRGVHDRLDVLNGRTQKGEVASAELRSRVVSLEKEIFRRRVTDGPDGGPGPAVPFFTKREKALVGLGVVVVGALMKFMLLAGEFVVEVARTALKAK